MKLIQILLPLRDNKGRSFSKKKFQEVRKELVDRFGGLTAYSRSPAKGLWKANRRTKGDDIVIFEVMAPRLQSAWWRNYRRTLERRFAQDEIIVRAQDIALL